jgi:hypothetical protein
MLLRDPVCPLATVILHRFHVQTHLLGNRSTDEPTDAVVLPIGGFRNLGDGRPFVPAQEFENFAPVDVIYRVVDGLPSSSISRSSGVFPK